MYQNRIEKYDMTAAVLKSFDELLHETVNEFKKIYKIQPEIAACAPGRVWVYIQFTDEFHKTHFKITFLTEI